MRALRGIDLHVLSGELVALRERSGSGKTTLLNVLAGLDNPTRGHVILMGQDLAKLDETARARLRHTSVDLLFQNAHLFWHALCLWGHLSVAEAERTFYTASGGALLSPWESRARATLAPLALWERGWG